jgi:hypothetical protein
MGRFATLPSRISRVHRIDEDHRIDRVQRPVLPRPHPFHHPVSNGRDGLLRHLRAVNLAQVRGDLTVSEPLRRQRDHQIIDSGQPSLALRHDHRLEAGLPVPRHLNLNRPRLGHQRFRPRPIPRIPAITTRRVVFTVPEMIVHFPFQGGLDDHLGQPGQQATLPGQLQPLGPRPRSQLPYQLLIHAISRLGGHIHRHNSHRCLSSLRSYTVDLTVPVPACDRVIHTSVTI